MWRLQTAQQSWDTTLVGLGWGSGSRPTIYCVKQKVIFLLYALECKVHIEVGKGMGNKAK